MHLRIEPILPISRMYDKRHKTNERGLNTMADTKIYSLISKFIFDELKKGNEIDIEDITFAITDSLENANHTALLTTSELKDIIYRMKKVVNLY